MNSATFLLAFNVAIGVSFAVAFLTLTRGSAIRLGRWCAAGFFSAAATVTVEALASVIPSECLTSTLSFGTLMMALTAIAIGLARHYGSRAAPVWLAGLSVAAVACNGLVVFDLPRGSWGQAVGYQGPFALVPAVAACVVARSSPRRPVDLALAAVLGLCALQFVAKMILVGASGHGPGVRDYIVSAYAFYSQTAGGILSLLLGLSLLGLIVTEVMEEAKLRLQRDSLSGVLNRAAFMEGVGRVMRKAGAAAPTTVILADLDRFKSINDRFGHAAGDEAIRAFGANLRTHFGDGALCGRIGGEEFCILVPGCTPPAARAHVEAVRSLNRRNRYASLPSDVVVTASFGVAVTDAVEPFEEALHRADMALYAAKTAGRDACRFAPARGPAAAGDPFRLRSAVPEPAART